MMRNGHLLMMTELLSEAMGNVVMDSGVKMSGHLSTATINEMAEHLGIKSSGGLDKCVIVEIRQKECKKGTNNKIKMLEINLKLISVE